MSIKNGDDDIFQKNLLEFNLYEPRRDKTVKGQLLGTAIVDLADYGVVKEVISIAVPMNCTRSFRNTTQPVLYLKIQPYDKVKSGSSLRGRLAKEVSLDKNDEDSVSTLMSEEYADEAEVASLTDDDDVSSHSSLATSSAIESHGGSPSQNKKNGTRMENQDLAPIAHSKIDIRSESESNEKLKDYSLHSTSLEFPSYHGSPSFAPASSSDISELDFPGVKSSTSSQAYESHPQIQEEVDNPTEVMPVKVSEKLNSENYDQPQVTRESEKNFQIEEDKHEKNGQAGQIPFLEDEISNKFFQDAVRKQVSSGSDSFATRDRIKHVKSVRSLMDSSRSNGFGSTVKQEAKIYPAEKSSSYCESKVQELEQRIRVLEQELREAAAIELGLYSVAAEHGSSVNKVHAPARRLSRLYFQASKGIGRVSAAKSAVSGLVVVARACGNDVPRLVFWLSNCVVLRAIVSEAFVEEQLPVSAGPYAERNEVGKGLNKKSPIPKWSISSSENKSNKNAASGSFEDKGNSFAFIPALEKVESWIFSRIIESIWWQTLTPHMQSSAAKVIDKIMDSGCSKNYRRVSSCGDQEQVDFSLQLWKKAFKDACERLCPVRAGGHECGCLPVLAKLIMEQCVARLDVAMFNAILRESADDIPTDPVSDPISDPRVLPIPAGISSFGAGAQLKNAIGNWSRWLTDLFGMDDDDAPDDEMDDDEDGIHKDNSSFKSFYLLKSLSDLMMLPKDMLLSESIRREVCPIFGAQLIKRVLEKFVPDEFCPDPIPDAVFEALDSEVPVTALENDAFEDLYTDRFVRFNKTLKTLLNRTNLPDILANGDGSITNFPCTAPAVFYSPPSATSLASIIGGSVGAGSQSQLRRSVSVLRRSTTSDDELDELDSPLNIILGDSFLASSPAQMRPNRKLLRNHGNNVVRYQLLREVWDNELEL